MVSSTIKSDTIRELTAIPTQAIAALALGLTEDACPYGHDTAQGIIWLQSYRLTLDRINDMESDA